MLYSFILSIVTPILCLISVVIGYNLKQVETGEKPVKMPKIKHKTRAERKADKETQKDYEEAIEMLKRIDDYEVDYGR